MNSIHLQQTLPQVFADRNSVTSDVWHQDLFFRKGEMYLIEAASGTGKSSLCSYIYGYRNDYQGIINFDETNIKAYSVKQWVDLRKHSLSMLFQDLRIFTELSALENVQLKNNLTGCKKKKEILSFFEQLGIADKINVKAGKLSFGQQQRVAFIRALCQPFDFLFLDEPTTGVDPVSRKEFWQMLRNLRKQGITIIVSTPIMDEARQCDRIAFINHGQVHGIDTPERILQKFASILCPPPLEREEAQQMAAPVIEVKQLTKSFGHFTAVDHISFQVQRGEIFGFLGANGAGKTTAMRMLCGLSRPTSGVGRVAGYDIFREAEQVKKHIGYMSQKFSLYEDLKVWENIRLFAGIYGMKEMEIEEKTDELLERLGFADERDTLVKKLPLGWKQKLAFSVSIFHEPKIVFLDEPTGGVDPATRRQFWELIYQAADRGITVFVTTHYMDEAEYCNRISIMVDGQIKALDTPARLKEQFGVETMDDVFQQLARHAVRKAD